MDAFDARRTIPADDLLIWSASAAKANPSALLPSNGQPNPLVVDDLVVCSVFSPGRVVAFDRESGRNRWGGRLRYYGQSNVRSDSACRLIYAGTSQELLALEATTGKLRWTFCPYGRKGETIYSSPAVADGRLFIGDLRGFLHCLAADTGKGLWRVETSVAENNSVNSDPVVADGVVAIGTNAALAIGFEATTGREVWRHRVAGPCIHCRPGGDLAALM